MLLKNSNIELSIEGDFCGNFVVLTISLRNESGGVMACLLRLKTCYELLAEFWDSD